MNLRGNRSLIRGLYAMTLYFITLLLVPNIDPTSLAIGYAMFLGVSETSSAMKSITYYKTGGKSEPVQK